MAIMVKMLPFGLHQQIVSKNEMDDWGWSTIQSSNLMIVIVLICSFDQAFSVTFEGPAMVQLYVIKSFMLIGVVMV